VVLATNIAETSVTVPDVRTVIDTGWQKVARYDAARALDTLQTERVSADAADQRAGRAARLGAGVAIRLWPERDRLRPFREPDIARIDLAPVLLAILAWGGDEATFEWFDAPAAQRQADARRLLARLGAIDDTGLTAVGRVLAPLPLAPRLSRMVAEAGGHPDACLVAALLSDGRAPSGDGRTAASDLLSLIPAARAMPHLCRAAESVRAALAEGQGAGRPMRRGERRVETPIGEDLLRRAVLAGFPDRVAQRRSEHGDTLLLSAGTGARLSAASGVRDAAWLVALDVRGTEGREAVVQLASGVERDWLVPTHTERRVWVDDAGRLRAVRLRRYDALTLQEQPDSLQPEDRTVLVRAWADAPRTATDRQWLARLDFAGIEVDLGEVLTSAAADLTRLDQIDLEGVLPWGIRQSLLTDAPARLPLPSGRTAALVYDHGGTVRAAVKLQELFGLAETPRVGPRHVPVVFELLAPNGRPVQTTQDLRSFWTTTYAEVRKQLRARYPKHPWPEDPWTATPTHRTTRRQ
jgi:ATP-dependent helicase HrpB